MNIFGIVGWRGVEKTALVQALVNHFSELGIQVSVISAELPFSEAGAPLGADLCASLAALPEVDLVLVDGFKTAEHEKLLVVPSHAPHQQENTQLLQAACPNVVALVVPEDCEIQTSVPLLPLGDVPKIANFILERCDVTVPREDAGR